MLQHVLPYLGARLGGVPVRQRQPQVLTKIAALTTAGNVGSSLRVDDEAGNGVARLRSHFVHHHFIRPRHVRVARALVGAILCALCVRAAAALLAAICGGETLGLV